MSPAIRRIAPLAAAALTSAALIAPAVSEAASTKSCIISGSRAQSLGPTYVTVAAGGKPGYKVRGTSCATGLKVVKAFHACRLKKGKTGRCTTKVRGYSCTEKRSDKLVLGGKLQQFDGDVTCKSGTRRVTHHYLQKT